MSVTSTQAKLDFFSRSSLSYAVPVWSYSSGYSYFITRFSHSKLTLRTNNIPAKFVPKHDHGCSLIIKNCLYFLRLSTLCCICAVWLYAIFLVGKFTFIVCSSGKPRHKYDWHHTFNVMHWKVSPHFHFLFNIHSFNLEQMRLKIVLGKYLFLFLQWLQIILIIGPNILNFSFSWLFFA